MTQTITFAEMQSMTAQTIYLALIPALLILFTHPLSPRLRIYTLLKKHREQVKKLTAKEFYNHPHPSNRTSEHFFLAFEKPLCFMEIANLLEQDLKKDGHTVHIKFSSPTFCKLRISKRGSKFLIQVHPGQHVPHSVHVVTRRVFEKSKSGTML